MDILLLLQSKAKERRWLKGFWKVPNRFVQAPALTADLLQVHQQLTLQVLSHKDVSPTSVCTFAYFPLDSRLKALRLLLLY